MGPFDEASDESRARKRSDEEIKEGRGEARRPEICMGCDWVEARIADSNDSIADACESPCMSDANNIRIEKSTELDIDSQDNCYDI